MEGIKRLPDSELEIMMIIWEAAQPVSSAYVMDKLAGEKSWANTTVLNFLARLVEKGFLTLSKQGRLNYYTSLIGEKEYLQKESQSFLERMHKSSWRNLVSALYDGEAIDKEDLEELRKYAEEVAKND